MNEWINRCNFHNTKINKIMKPASQAVLSHPLIFHPVSLKLLWMPTPLTRCGGGDARRKTLSLRTNAGTDGGGTAPEYSTAELHTAVLLHGTIWTGHSGAAARDALLNKRTLQRRGIKLCWAAQAVLALSTVQWGVIGRSEKATQEKGKKVNQISFCKSIPLRKKRETVF